MDKTTVVKHLGDVISAGALILSCYNYYRINVRSKLILSAGKHALLTAGSIDKGTMKPMLLVPITILNDGGKPVVVTDIKLLITVKNDTGIIFSEEFYSLREYLKMEITGDVATVQNELEPIIVPARESVLKKIVFCPTIKTIDTSSMPKSINFILKPLLNIDGKWQEFTSYHADNVTDVWSRLESSTQFGHRLVEIYPLQK